MAENLKTFFGSTGLLKINRFLKRSISFFFNGKLTFSCLTWYLFHKMNLRTNYVISGFSTKKNNLGLADFVFWAGLVVSEVARSSDSPSSVLIDVERDHFLAKKFLKAVGKVMNPNKPFQKDSTFKN